MTTYEQDRPYLATVRGVEKVLVGWDGPRWWSAVPVGVGDGLRCHDSEHVTDVRPAWVVEGLEGVDPEFLRHAASRFTIGASVFRALTAVADAIERAGDPIPPESVEGPLHPGEPPRDGKHVAIDAYGDAWTWRGDGWVHNAMDARLWPALATKYGPMQVARLVEAGEDQ